MKKIISLILVVLYVGTSTGATFHMHYCMGKLTDVRLWHKEVMKCDKCNKGKSALCTKKCCRDKHKTIKLDKDQKITERALYTIHQAAVAIPVAFADMPSIFATSLAEEFPVTNAPPGHGKIPVHILNCTYRI